MSDGQPGFGEEEEVVASTPNFDISTGEVSTVPYLT